MKIKQHLLERKCINTASTDVEADKKIQEYETIVKKYENEIQELRSTSISVSKDSKTGKISEERRKKITLLEAQVDVV